MFVLCIVIGRNLCQLQTEQYHFVLNVIKYSFDIILNRKPILKHYLIEHAVNSVRTEAWLNLEYPQRRVGRGVGAGGLYGERTLPPVFYTVKSKSRNCRQMEGVNSKNFRVQKNRRPKEMAFLIYYKI